MDNYVTIDDITKLFRALNPTETERATALIPIVCDSLRQEAIMRGKDLDKMIEDKKLLKNVLISVMVDIISRTLMTSTEQEPMTQFSQSALGYTYSGTFLNPGGGLFIKKSELVRLGLKRQQYGAIELCPLEE